MHGHELLIHLTILRHGGVGLHNLEPFVGLSPINTSSDRIHTPMDTHTNMGTHSHTDVNTHSDASAHTQSYTPSDGASSD